MWQYVAPGADGRRGAGVVSYRMISGQRGGRRGVARRRKQGTQTRPVDRIYRVRRCRWPPTLSCRGRRLRLTGGSLGSRDRGSAGVIRWTAATTSRNVRVWPWAFRDPRDMLGQTASLYWAEIKVGTRRASSSFYGFSFFFPPRAGAQAQEPHASAQAGMQKCSAVQCSTVSQKKKSYLVLYLKSFFSCSTLFIFSNNYTIIN